MPSSRNARRSDLPSTIQRSDKKAQDTFTETYNSALQEYGSEQRAARVAYAALKHTHEKVGDRWRPKKEFGPSDAHAAEGAGSSKPTAGGVDANSSRQHLYDLARELDIRGRSSMTKDELVDALRKAQRKR